MIGSVTTKYAFRSLLRHLRRTILSVLGVGIGCGIGLFATSWQSGSADMQIRAASESGAGHLRIVPDGWAEKRENTLRLPQWQDALAEAKQLPNVKSVMPRARTNGLLALGNRTVGVELVGVHPEAELAGNRIVFKSRIEGRYLTLEDEGKVVIGKALATRLDIELGDDLYATLVGRDEIKSAMLRVAGILDTGSADLDTTVCHTTLRDLERISGYAGAGEISLLLDEHRLIPARQRQLAASVPAGCEVITWKDVAPALAANVEGDTAFMRGIIGIIVVVVALGIASAQLTAVLERRREFAILSALGMKDRQIIGLVVIEALLIGIGGAVVSLLLGGASAYWLATEGVSLAAMMGEGEVSFADVLLDPTLYGDFGIWLVWHAFLVSMMATLASSIYPAWLATKVDPAEALRMV